MGNSQDFMGTEEGLEVGRLCGQSCPLQAVAWCVCVAGVPVCEEYVSEGPVMYV